MSRVLFKSTAVVAFMTFLSRVTGLIRETIIASYFGAGAGMDAFLVAFKIPNFFRRLFAEGSFTQAFVPVLSQMKSTHDEEEVRSFIQKISGTLGVIVLFFSFLGSLCSPWIVALFAPGFLEDGERFNLASQMLRITFPYLFFITMTALSAGILNAFHRYAIPAFTPALLNIVFILFVYLIAPWFQDPIHALSWSVVAGGLAQMVFQLPFIFKIRCLVRPLWAWKDSSVKKVVTLMIPTLIGGSVVQISLVIDTLFASYLEVGSLSWLYFADRLLQFPLAIIGVALSTVLLPHLSSQHALGQKEVFMKMLYWGFRLIVLIVVPASIGLIVLSGPLVISLYQYGYFTARDAQMCEHALMAYSTGLLFFITARVLTTVCYSQQDMKTPVKIAMIALVCNVLLNVILTHYFAHIGLALATSLSSFINVLGLLWVMKKRVLLAWSQIELGISIKMIVSAFFMGFVLYVLKGDSGLWLSASVGVRSFWLLSLVLGGIILYALALFLMGLRPRHFVMRSS